ncbi:MAG: hypothetical protein WD827_03100 [Solirubrobacterales bacterium]
MALGADLFRRRPARPRELLPLALAAGALLQALGVGAAGWVGLLFALLAGSWLLPGWRTKKLPPSVVSVVCLGILAAICIVPVWVTLSDFLANDSGLFSSGQDEHTRLGNLNDPLSGFQLAGIWPVGDFRVDPPGLPTVLLVGLALLAALGALWGSVKRREFGLLLYVAVALGTCGLISLAGATPWVIGKTLAISTPALLVAALTGAAMLAKRRRAVGVFVLGVLAAGVLWSNALAYHEALLAPRDRLAELQRIGDLVADKPSTLINEYEYYAENHFLREGAGVGPTGYRSVNLALSDGTLLITNARADIDSFPLSTVQEYRSIVTRRSPAESRPPSNYRLAWQGDYYNLWQRSEAAATNIVEHIPFGESTTLPYCGEAQGGALQPECSINPVATPTCGEIRDLAQRAASLDAHLVAYQQAEPIFARGDQSRWPGEWFYNPESHTLTARTPGEVVSNISVSSEQVYELWLGGSFARGFDVSIGGRPMGRVENELSSIAGYIHVDDVFLPANTYQIELTYPDSDLTPGSGDNTLTTLDAIVLQPQKPGSALITAAPDEAKRLCGRPLDWIEIVTDPA